MTGTSIDQLAHHLTDRDRQLLYAVDQYRLLTTRQLQRLHFDTVHPTPIAAARACSRTLLRLKHHGVLATLERRIGGARAGSAGFVWYLGPAGDRLLRHLNPDAHRGRHNYREPSRHFVDHTLAIAELAVQTIEASRHGSFELLAIQTEPDSWQQGLSPHGTASWLKPDLRLVTATLDTSTAASYEHHWFIEVDRATEHLPVITKQCAAYRSFQATGRYQAEHQLFPAVVWIAPTESRRRAIEQRIAEDPHLPSGLFTVIDAEQFVPLLSGDAETRATHLTDKKAEPP